MLVLAYTVAVSGYKSCFSQFKKIALVQLFFVNGVAFSVNRHRIARLVLTSNRGDQWSYVKHMVDCLGF